jgi:hypothetical protein
VEIQSPSSLGVNDTRHTPRTSASLLETMTGTAFLSTVLLRHQSVRVTEKHYNPRVRSRQEQLEADVRNAWANDATLKMTGTKEVQIAKAPVN